MSTADAGGPVGGTGPGAGLRLPMFPLGRILFPHERLALRVFEERYRVLVERCLAGDRRLGVVLIERGHEVGGGDARFDLGVRAAIVRAREVGDGVWLLEVGGEERLRVLRWLPDDPHPWAEVELLPDPEPGPEADGLVDGVHERARALLSLRAELGEPGPPASTSLTDQPSALAYQAASACGINALDALGLLEIAAPEDRLARVLELLDEAVTLARARLELP